MANTERNAFPIRLCQAIKAAGLTQEKLAHAIGIAAPNVYFWKTGRNMPSTEHLLAIADVLDVSIDWLFGREVEGNA